MSQVREDFFDGFSCGLACRRKPHRLIGGRLIVVGSTINSNAAVPAAYGGFMPRIRPLRAISLGGSPAVGGSWTDARLDDEPRPALRVVPLKPDGSGWYCSVVSGKTEVGRLAYCPAADPAGPWRWAIKFGPDGWADSRSAALQALAAAWAGPSGQKI
jgi:hypothetical protein